MTGNWKLETGKSKMGSRCNFWLPKKKRFCANSSLSNSSFCGNHTKRSDGQWIPCPIDPSHSVLEENLDGHLKRCPLLKQVQTLSLQPFYQKGINAGKEDEEIQDGLGNFDTSNEASSVSLDNVSSEIKRNAVYAMTVPEFCTLISKIKSLHSSICSDIPYSYKIPEACDVWINREVDGKLPFQEKHVLQQASILGNLEEFGVLKPSANGVMRQKSGHNRLSGNVNDVSAVIEFGAGRGYLTQMLADCYGIEKVILVERKSYKLKADRSLRQKETLTLERLRIDIEDLNLNAIDSLRGVPYLAIGKHLCGTATDMTLRCCIPEQHNLNNGEKCKINSCLRGIAIATCCHHHCQWKHYINKQYLSNMGITKDDFHAITWFTSWAVDADHSSDLSVANVSSNFQIIENKKYIRASDSCGVEEIVSNMSAVERAVLGFMCKDIIDVGRLMWAKGQGLDTKIVKYVSPRISPENHLLIARP